MTTPISSTGLPTTTSLYTEVAAATHTTAAGLEYSQTVVQDGDNEDNRFSLSKIEPQGPEQDSVVLLLPGSNMNFDSYLIGDHPLAVTLSNQGYPVYGCDPRTEHTSFPSDIFNQETQDWGFDTYLRDIEYAVQRIKADYPEKKIILGGMSIGAILTYAAVNKNPSLYDGVILIDGTLYSQDDGFIDVHNNLCDNYTAQMDNGIYLDSIYGAGFKSFKWLADKTKNIPLLNTTQTALWQSLTTQVAGWHEGHTFATPGPEPLSYQYSTAENLNTLIDRLNNLQAHAIYRDYTCAMARPADAPLATDRPNDPTTKYIYNLGAFTKPVFAISAEHGYGPYIADGLSIWGSAQVGTVTHFMRAGVSHIDLLTARDQDTMINTDLLRWLDENGF